MTPSNEWFVFRRQPVVAIWLLIATTTVKILKNFWPFILVVLIRGNKKGAFNIEQLLLSIPVLILIGAILEYINFKFRIDDGNILVKRGILKKEHVTVPLNKVQSINIDQNWFHKLVNLVKVSIDSPGTEKAEVKLHLLMQDAIDLKTFVLSYHGEDIAQINTNKKQPISRLSASGLFKLGLSANHLETLAILFGLSLSFLNNIRDVIRDEFDKLETSAVNLIANSTRLIIYLLIAVLVISIVASFIRIIIKYANFTISKTEKGFSISTGLINSTEQLITFDKIQYVSWKSNWIRTKLPIFLLEYHAVGNRELQEKLKVKVPITSEKTLNTLTGIYGNGLDESYPAYLTAKEYIFRKTLFTGILPFLILGGIVYYYAGALALVFAILPVYVFFSAKIYQAKFRLRFNASLIHIQNGAFGRSEVFVKWHKIQSVAVVQGYYQRHHALADLKLFTAGGTITIPYMQLSEAQYIANLVLYKIESGKENWM